MTRLRAALEAAEARIAELEELLASVRSQPSTPTATPPATPEKAKAQSKRSISTAHLAEQKQQLQATDEGA